MNRTFQRTLTREEIRGVACPVCDVPSGSPCSSEPATGARREHHHAERVAAARTANSRQRVVQRALDAKRHRVANRMLRP